MRWVAAVCGAGLALAGCADPHFIHDPQVGFFSQEQLPGLLKSLRCELVTYIASNNQRHTINDYFSGPTQPVRNRLFANSQYPFFPIDPGKYGGMSIELKIQDTLGTQSGTSFDWKRTPADGIHTKVWHIAPNLGEQNSYDMLTGFLLRQDIYGLYTSDADKSAPDELATDAAKPYFCYKSIPARDPAIVNPSLINAGYVRQDLDAAAADGTNVVAQFERIRVNGGLPLAAWLQQTGKTLSSTVLTQSDGQKNEAISPGQSTYTFVIQTTAGLDVRNTIATTLWTGIGAEVLGGLQHTGTLTLYLNGNDSALTSGVKSGSSVRQSSKQTYPPIKSTTSIQYCERAEIGKVYKFNKDYCYWSPPQVKTVLERGKFKELEAIIPPKPAKPKAVPAYRDFRSPGTLIYPITPSPLGTPAAPQ